MSCRVRDNQAFDQFCSKQFAPGLTRLLLQGAPPPRPEGVANGDTTGDALDDERLPTAAAVSTWSYAMLAAEVSRLQRNYVVSELQFIEANRRERVAKAMLHRADALARQHPVLAGWTHTQLSQHVRLVKGFRFHFWTCFG